MVQTVIVILIVAGAAAYIARQAYRFFVPRMRAGKMCGGSCCSQGEAPAPAGPRTQMITSDSLRVRIKARQTEQSHVRH